MARTITIKVLVEPAERDAIRQAAKLLRRTVSDYVRVAALDDAERDLEWEDQRQRERAAAGPTA
jgi:uncharacterized protein (DUF1778 family)